MAAALGISDAPGFAVGTSFEFDQGVFKAVASQKHPAFSSGLPLKEGLLSFLKTEQLPPYLPYTTATNERVFAMERQARLLQFFISISGFCNPACSLCTITVCPYYYSGFHSLKFGFLNTNDPAIAAPYIALSEHSFAGETLNWVLHGLSSTVVVLQSLSHTMHCHTGLCDWSTSGAAAGQVFTEGCAGGSQPVQRALCFCHRCFGNRSGRHAPGLLWAPETQRDPGRVLPSPRNPPHPQKQIMVFGKLS